MMRGLGVRSTGNSATWLESGVGAEILASCACPVSTLGMNRNCASDTPVLFRVSRMLAGTCRGRVFIHIGTDMPERTVVPGMIHRLDNGVGHKMVTTMDIHPTL